MWTRRELGKMLGAVAAAQAMGRARPAASRLLNFHGGGGSGAGPVSNTFLFPAANEVRRISRALQSISGGGTLPLLTINSSGTVTTGTNNTGSGTSRPSFPAGPGTIQSILIVQQDNNAGTSAGTFTASFSSGVMTVTGTPSFNLVVGMVLSGTGVTAGTTIILPAGTGTGGAGTYNVSNNLTLGSNTYTATFSNAGGDDQLQISIDGEGSSSISFDCGQILTHNSTIGEYNWTNNFAGGNSGGGAYGQDKFILIRLPIFYKNSITINYVNTGGHSMTLWWDIEVCPGVRDPYKLVSSNLPRLTPTVLTNTQINNRNSGGGLTMLNLGAGNAGWVASIHMHMWSGGFGNSFSYLEATPCVYLDGNAPTGSNQPDWACDGNEGHMWDAFYYTASPPSQPNTRSSNTSAVSAKIFGTTTASVNYVAVTTLSDLIAAEGGLKFTNGVIVKYEQVQDKGSPTTTTTAFSYLVLYYIPNP